ncbi:MAG: class I SAM-dependent methyltransferase [Syntrophorhabdales bacterium]
MADWDRRYREGFYAGPHEVHDLVERYSPLMPSGKPVLDIAMGRGGDLLFVARKGYPAYGLDTSREAILLARQAMKEGCVDISPILGDARFLPFKEGGAAGVLVFYFLLREIMADLIRLLMPGGILLYETFLKGQNAIDRPRDPAYLLEDGELLGYFRHLDLLYYEEGIFTTNGKQRALARYAGRKR